jgi:hypothetical protein
MSADTTWESLIAFSETYTCYSSAVATWVAHEREDWPTIVNPGLTLTVIDASEGALDTANGTPAVGDVLSLFGFAHFPPLLRARLGLTRVAVEDPDNEAVAGVLAELERSGRVIVAGDGLRLPWHVAHGKRHVPHWFVLTGTPDALETIDPFACRNELGVQLAIRTPIARTDLAEMLVGLPGEDPAFALRERFALGDDCEPPRGACQWFVHGEVGDSRSPAGLEGPAGALALARHFHEHGQDPRAYAQADDIWSVARHRAFLARHAAAVAERSGEEALAAWVREHGEPLAKRWSHMAPLLMQATLALGSERAASGSVPDTLENLAARESAALQAFPSPLDVGSI